jgi:hypothetical protein
MIFFVVAHWEMQLQSKRFLKPKCSESIAKAVGVVWLVSLWTYCFHWDRPVHREAGKFGRFCFGVCWQAFRRGLFSVSLSRQSWLVFSLPSSTASSETDGICSLPFTFVHTFCSLFFSSLFDIIVFRWENSHRQSHFRKIWWETLRVAISPLLRFFGVGEPIKRW